eukprot:symbB.v1.2.000824.t1/scaffold49.1/size384103/8
MMRGLSLYLYCLTFLVFGSCKELHRCTKGGRCRSDLVGPTLLQVRGKLRQGQGKVQLLENHDGNCLEASNMADNGAGPSMEVCDGQNDLQHWHHDVTSGLLTHIGGKCLDASQRDIPNGRIHLWDCDASNKNQMWDWLPETQQFKNRYGLCMDAPHPQRPGSHIHMWTCREDLSNQRWVFHDIDVTITTTTETSTSSVSTSTSTSTFTTSTSAATTSTSEVTTSSSSTSTTTPQPLSAVRNCQLEPLVEGSGCKRVAVFEADIFGLGENGQETEGRHRCLEKLREEPAAESFVHAIGRCELWHCVTYARLKMSAGPGGGLSSSPNAIALVDRHQRYVTALEDGGHMEAVEGSFVPEALFYLEEVKPGRFTLKAASNQLFVKAIPGGRLVAETQQWDDWELFELEKTEDKVALKSFHYSYVTVDDAGHVSAGSWERTADTDFTLVNRSLAAWEEEHGALAQRGMLKTFSSSMDHAICQWPSSTANVRCCGDDSKVVLEESYGCFEHQTFAEAGGLNGWLAASFMTLPPDYAVLGQSKSSRIYDICDSATGSMGEGLIELEVLSISGECMLTLNVSDSMLGRDLWNVILDKVPAKPGLQLVVSHTSKLVLNESLKQQGLGGQRAQVSAIYMPVNLLAALHFAHGPSVEDEEFSLNGITEMTGVSHAMPAQLLHNLPESLRKLTFAHFFNQGLHHVRLPAGLQSLTFGANFNQSLDNVTWPAGLQSLTFGKNFNQNLYNVTWPAGLESLTLGEYFNQSLENVLWPAGLQSLTFGYCFNQSLDNVTWPAGLQSLTFVGDFDQSLDNVTWPAGLENLVFHTFPSEKLNVVWPEGLQSLSFLHIELPEEDSDDSDSSVDPEGLLRAWLPRMAGWPRALRKLVFCDLALVC